RMMFEPGKMHLSASGIPMTQFIEMLSNQLGQPVVDQTGLKDKYDIDLEFAPDPRAMGAMGMPMMPPPPGGAPGGGGPAPDADSLPGLQTAVQDLGLKLESKKAPLDIVTIDRIEKTPAEN
ncbi:MAG: TIGR03435 family protein, partial [Acidobacteriota bacterium]|nr:TIGR03435 family protein [Acidobacteriota bacterium]